MGAPLDIAAVAAEQRRLLGGELPQCSERDIVQGWRDSVAARAFDDRLPMRAEDTIGYEMAFKYGRADIVVFHVDGSASVIEVKDGTKGYAHVVAGIGQVALYAAQLGVRRLNVREVRRCLLWSSTGNVFLDGVIEQACEDANVVPLPWPAVRLMVATRIAAAAVARARG